MKAKKPRRLQGFEGHGRDRIRTCEGVSHQIYSLTRLSTSVHARVWQTGGVCGRGLLRGRGKDSMTGWGPCILIRDEGRGKLQLRVESEPSTGLRLISPTGNPL